MEVNCICNANYVILDYYALIYTCFLYYFIELLLCKLSVQESWTMKIIQGNKVQTYVNMVKPWWIFARFKTLLYCVYFVMWLCIGIINLKIIINYWHVIMMCKVFNVCVIWHLCCLCVNDMSYRILGMKLLNLNLIPFKI